MFTKIIAPVSAGKTHYSIEKVLRRIYLENACIITLELNEKTVMNRITNFVVNQNISVGNNNHLSVKEFALQVSFEDIKEFIVKKSEDGFKTFLLDSPFLVKSIKGETNSEKQDRVDKELYNLCMEYDCNIYATYNLNREFCDLSIQEIYEKFPISELKEFEDVIVIKIDLMEDKSHRKAVDIRSGEVEVFNIENFFKNEEVA